MKSFTEFVAEDKDPGEYDQEGQMAMTQLNNIIDAAEDLLDMLEDDENLPEWVQSKITKAEDYLDSVRDYLMNLDDDEEEEDGEEDMEEGTGSLKPGWMLKKDPKLAAAVKAKIDLAKKRNASHGNPAPGKSDDK